MKNVTKPFARLILLLGISVMCFTMAGMALDNYAEIGIETRISRHPFFSQYADSRDQVIYLASEMVPALTAGPITKIAFYNITTNGFPLVNWNIRMQNTTLSSTMYMNAFVEDGWTTVYSSQSFSFQGTGWQIITLQTPFIWDGESNLYIEFCHDNADAVYGNSWSVLSTNTPLNFQGMYAYTNVGAGCSLSAQNLSDSRANIRIYQPASGALTGTVTSCCNDIPLTGAVVSCGGMNSTTGADGTYTITGITPGTYTTTCSFPPSYLPASVEVIISDNQTAAQDFCLNPDPPLVIDAGVNQVVYDGYPPQACTTLSWTGVSGGTPPYTTHWNTGETTQSITVCPEVTTVYTVTVTDANGCTSGDDVKVCVIDVHCNNNPNLVEMCKPELPHGNAKPRTICVPPNQVPNFLSLGWKLGACGTDLTCTGSKSIAGNSEGNTDVTKDGKIILDAYPNPFTVSATVKFTCPDEGYVSVKLINNVGMETAVLLEKKVDKDVLYSVEVDGSKLSQGLYFCLLQHSDGTMQIKKLIYTK
jgi:hypothetical protein